MSKKLFSLLLIALISNMCFVPVMAKTEKKSAVVDKNFILIDTNYVSSLNINDSNINQPVQFVVSKNYKNSKGFIIPKGTIFYGKIKNLHKSNFGYRRADATVEINSMVLPDGQQFKVKGYMKNPVIKGTAARNIAKGIVTAPAVIAVGAIGAVAIIAEIVTIAGVMIVEPTATLTGNTLGKLTTGINCKKHFGDDATIGIKFADSNSFDKLIEKTSLEGKVYPLPQYEVPVKDLNMGNKSQEKMKTERILLPAATTVRAETVQIKEDTETLPEQNSQ